MALQLSVQPYAMTGNPIAVTMTSTGEDAELVRLLITCGGMEFVETYRLKGTLCIDVADVLSSAAAPAELLQLDTVLRLVNPLPQAQVQLKDSYNAAAVTETCTLFYGGFGEDKLAAINGTSADLITARLLAADSQNPFMTTRSSTPSIAMREGEVQPLCFAAAGGETVTVEVTTSDNETRTYDTESSAQARLLALDLRPLINDSCKHFTVKLRNSVVHVAITPNPTARRVRLATFLNSLGVYESLMLTGQAEVKSSVAESDDAALNLFNSRTLLYERQRARRGITDSITLYAGYRTPDEVAFLNDLIISPHILLDGRSAVCTTTELISYADTDSAEPREVELTFEYAVTRYHYSPM